MQRDHTAQSFYSKKSFRGKNLCEVGLARVARARRLRMRSLAPQIAMPSSASRGLKAAWRSNPQIRRRESNLWR